MAAGRVCGQKGREGGRGARPPPTHTCKLTRAAVHPVPWSVVGHSVVVDLLEISPAAHTRAWGGGGGGSGRGGIGTGFEGSRGLVAAPTLWLTRLPSPHPIVHPPTPPELVHRRVAPVPRALGHLPQCHHPAHHHHHRRVEWSVRKAKKGVRKAKGGVEEGGWDAEHGGKQGRRP